MPLLRLIAEGVGPFERLDLDFSDGHGNPHLGPHILAGVNGSGKSTALRAIAWVMSWVLGGFDLTDWRHLLAGHPNSRGVILLRPPHFDTAGWACTRGDSRSVARSLLAWLRTVAIGEMPSVGFLPVSEPDQEGFQWAALGETVPAAGLAGWVNVTSYAPSRRLKCLERPDRAETPTAPFKDSLAFESTVDNEGIQAWLLSLHTRRAIAKERGQPAQTYERSLAQFESALQMVCGARVSSEVGIEPSLQLYLRVFGQRLNFSQLPDGVRNTVGWLADFMMRQDLMEWDPALKGRRPGILLLDEVDAHLHPRWQRTLLPAMRAALPDVQIIVTSHSPFVISSCAGARVHMLELDERTGRAHALPPVDAPFGASVMATLKDIFGVSSRFDVDTQRKLEEWNELLRKEAVAALPPRDRKRLNEVTAELSQRSEELRSIVGVRLPPGRNSRSKRSKRRQRMAG